MKIETVDQLRSLYNSPSVRAKEKELKELDVHTRRFIETSPFAIIGTRNENGSMDTSPRGGQPGFVKILSDGQIAFADAKGNNRLDSLTNIIKTSNVGMLFLIPGMDETLRVNGNAYITTDANILDLFSSERITPKVGVVVNVEEVFLHCAKALMRSKLWNEESKIERSNFPTMGEILKDQLGSKDAPESQEKMVERYMEDL